MPLSRPNSQDLITGRYATPSETCDVHIYQNSTLLFRCLNCQAPKEIKAKYEYDRHGVSLPDPQYVLRHLYDHLTIGHKVPESLFDRLINEMWETDEGWLEMRQEKEYVKVFEEVMKPREPSLRDIFNKYIEGRMDRLERYAEKT